MSKVTPLSPAPGETGPALVSAVIHRLSGLLRGKEQVIEFAISAFLARGHLLLEGPPGTGKTSLAKAIASVFGGSFRRVQMTSDLLPSDITGVLRLKPSTNEFEFRPGPLFTNFLLADELNRTSPKTQSALLEAMAEGTVTVDGISHKLPDPFFVVATQNPLEYQGVYPLAESELDRFMLRLPVTPPKREDEFRIYNEALNAANGTGDPHEALELNLKQLHSLFESVAKIRVEKSVLEYGTELVRATREAPEITSGASVRGGLQFFSAARALAFVRGREFVIPTDLRELAVPALAHRLSFSSGQGLQRGEEVIREILERVAAPK